MKRILQSLWLLRAEAAVTAMLICMPIITDFYTEIGMSLAQIGLSQSVFTVVMLLLNIPTGWLADRFSPRLSNAVGDSIAAAGFIGYAFAQNFTHVILAEVIVGLGIAISRGADAPLRVAYCKVLGRSLNRENSRAESWALLASAAAVLIGGIVGAYDLRLAMGLTALPYVIGAILSLMVIDAGKRLDHSQKPFQQMRRVICSTVFHNARLRWLIIAYAVGSKITHPVIWVLTPLLIQAGVPLELVGFGWALNIFAAYIGSLLARRYGESLSEWQRFAAPMVAALTVMMVLSVHVSIETVWLYAILGLVRGWIIPVTKTMVQQAAPSRSLATVMSITDNMGHLLYAPLVASVTLVGSVQDARPVMMAMVVVFIPLVIVTTQKLRYYERK